MKPLPKFRDAEEVSAPLGDVGANEGLEGARRGICIDATVFGFARQYLFQEARMCTQCRKAVITE